MNSIVFTHFATPVESVSILDLASERLGAWLDAERDTLGRLLAQLGRGQAVDALEALEQLHLEPTATMEDLRELLEEAETYLGVLLETLRAIPSRCQLETAWGLPGPEAFNEHVRWSGARLEDILMTLDRALVA
jgi:hypothetical protein